MYEFTLEDVTIYQIGWLSDGQKKQWVKFANEAIKISEATTNELKKEEAILVANTKLSSTVPSTALMFSEHEINVKFTKKEDDSDDIKLDMVGYSGGIIKDHWWWGDLAIDLEGLTFTAKKFPILENHDTARKLAFTGKPIVSEKGVVADQNTTVFLDNEYSNEFIKNSKAGFPYQSSLYVVPLSIERLEKDAEVEVNGFTMKGPGTVFRKAEFKEMSACVFGWDNNTKASAFTQALPVETSFVFSKKIGDQVSDNDLKNQENSNINLEDTIMDLVKFKADHPELYAEVLDEGKKAAETTFGSKEKELKDEIVVMQTKITTFEKKEVIRTEKELRVDANSLFVSKLVKSDIPEHLHSKVMPHVQYSKFVTEDKLDIEAFTKAIDAEIESWVEAGISSSIMGSSFSTESETEVIEKEQKLEQEIDASVDSLLSVVQVSK
jgi:hypothetical protein